MSKILFLDIDGVPNSNFGNDSHQTGGISAAFRMAVIFIRQCGLSVAGVPDHGIPPVFIGVFMVRRTYKKQVACTI